MEDFGYFLGTLQCPCASCDRKSQQGLRTSRPSSSSLSSWCNCSAVQESHNDDKDEIHRRAVLRSALLRHVMSSPLRPSSHQHTGETISFCGYSEEMSMTWSLNVKTAGKRPSAKEKKETPHAKEKSKHSHTRDKKAKPSVKDSCSLISTQHCQFLYHRRRRRSSFSSKISCCAALDDSSRLVF
jgi:hypothetical protein